MMVKGKNHNVFIDFCFEFFLPTATHEDGDVSLLIGSRQQTKDAEEEGDEEDKKMDSNKKVTLELTARSIIASCGLRRACMETWSRTRWETLRIIWMTE